MTRQFGATISAESARALIQQRFGGDQGDRATGETAHEIARLIVKALPDDAMYANILGSLDLRPYLNVVLSKADKSLPDMYFHNWRDLTQSFMDRIQGDYVRKVAAQQGVGTPESAAMAKQVQQFNPGLITVDPLANATTAPGVGTPPGAQTPVTPPPGPTTIPGQTTTTVAPSGPTTATTVGPTAAADDADHINLGGDPAATPPIPRSTYERMISSPGWDPEKFRNLAKAGNIPLSLDYAQFEEAQFNPDDSLQQPFGPLGLKVSGAYIGEAVGKLPKGARRSITAVQALHWLKDQTEEEVANVQDKMVQAGMLEYGKFDKGNAWDEATSQAWQGLLTESYQRDVPTDQVLAGYAARRQQAERVAHGPIHQLIERVPGMVQRSVEAASLAPLTHPDLDSAADDYAMKVIGRPLRLDEKAQLFAFMASKRSESRQQILAGKTSADQASADETSAFQGRLDTVIEPEKDVTNWDTARNSIFKRAGVKIPDDITPPVATTAQPRVRYPGES